MTDGQEEDNYIPIGVRLRHLSIGNSIFRYFNGEWIEVKKLAGRIQWSLESSGDWHVAQGDMLMAINDPKEFFSREMFEVEQPKPERRSFVGIARDAIEFYDAFSSDRNFTFGIVQAISEELDKWRAELDRRFEDY